MTGPTSRFSRKRPVASQQPPETEGSCKRYRSVMIHNEEEGAGLGPRCNVGLDYEEELKKKEEEELSYEEIKKKLTATEKEVERLGKVLQDRSRAHVSRLEKYMKERIRIQSELSDAEKYIRRLKKAVEEQREYKDVLVSNLAETHADLLRFTSQLPKH